jgi:hypothetical protein
MARGVLDSHAELDGAEAYYAAVLLAGLRAVELGDVLEFVATEGRPGKKPRAVCIKMIAPASEGSP